MCWPERSDHSAWQAVLLNYFEQKLRGGSYKQKAKHRRSWHSVSQHLHSCEVYC